MAMGMQQQYMQGGLQPVPQGIVIPMDPDTSGGQQQAVFALPAALMAQYPQLVNLDWNAISSQNMGDDGDLSDVGYDLSYDEGLDMTGNTGVPVGVGWQGQG